MIRVLVKQKERGLKNLIWFLWSLGCCRSVIFIVVGLKFSNNTEALNMLKSVDLVNGIGMAFCIALLPLNIGIETWKWQHVLKPIQYQSFSNCMKIILAGKKLECDQPIWNWRWIFSLFGIIKNE